MSQKTKYILSVVAGFAVILGLGIVAIKLLKAKHAAAPEDAQQPASVHDKSTDSQAAKADEQTKKYREALESFPREQGVAGEKFANLPEDIQTFFPEGGRDVTVYKVQYENGLSGYRIERDRDVTLPNLFVEWNSRLNTWKDKIGRRSVDSGIIEANNGMYKVQLFANKLTSTTTSQVVQVVVLKR